MKLKNMAAGLLCMSSLIGTAANAGVIHGITKGPGNDTTELSQVIAELSPFMSTTGFTALGKVDQSDVASGVVASESGYGEALSFDFSAFDVTAGEVTSVSGGLAAGSGFTLMAVLIADGTVSSLYYDNMFTDMSALDGTKVKGISHVSYFGTVEMAAVPLPAGAILMLTGMGGIVAMRRRKTA